MNIEQFGLNDVDNGNVVNNINPAPFDFMDIKDDDNVIDIPDDEEEVIEEEEEVEDEDHFEDTTSITEALSQLGAIDDDYELDFGSQKVSKGELVRLLGDRENIIKTRDAIDSLSSRMAGREQDIELVYTVGKTETDKQLEHVYAMLNDPDKWNSSTDVGQLQRARIQLEQRKAELDKVRDKALTSLQAQKQELDQARIQRVVTEMGSNIPLQEAAQYAEAKGIDLNALVAGCSPALVLALQNAKKYDDLVNNNKKRLETKAQTKKPVSTSTKPKSTSKVSPSQRARAQQLYKQGKLSNADMFNFLED